MGKGRFCGDCRFCCWSFAVADIPDATKGIEVKSALKHCQYECSLGCKIHEEKNYPQPCKDFTCPYLNGDNIYRPNTFQKLLEDLNGNIGNYIPDISLDIPVKDANCLVKKTRSIPASILIANKWTKVIMTLDRKEDKSWSVAKETFNQWEKLYNSYGVELHSSVKNNIGVKMI